MSKQTTATAKQPAAFAVVLAKSHEHAGIRCAAGESINVSADQQAWLEAFGVIGQSNQEKQNV